MLLDQITLKFMCLAEFVSNYDVKYGETGEDDITPNQLEKVF